MDDFSKEKKEEILKAHKEELKKSASASSVNFMILSKTQIQAAVERYVTFCAEYSACKGIYDSYHKAGLDEKACTFSVAATIAAENAKAVDSVLDILKIDHQKFEL